MNAKSGVGYSFSLGFRLCCARDKQTGETTAGERGDHRAQWAAIDPDKR